MYCDQCGKEVENDARFCEYCGAKIENNEYGAAASAVEDRGRMPVNIWTPVEEKTDTGKEAAKAAGNKSRKRLKKALLVTLVILVLALAAGLGIGIYHSPTRKVNAQLDLGNRYLEDMEYEEAIVAFEAAIAIDPKKEDAYIGLADAYIGLDDYETAVKILEESSRDTGSDILKDYLKEVQERWDDQERRVYGGVYAVDTDLDDTNNVGIPDITISVTDSSGHTVTSHTDENGSYDSERLEKGTYTIHISGEGYVEYEEKVSLTGGKYELNAYLEPDIRATLYGSVLIGDADTDYSNNEPLCGALISLTKQNGSNEFSATAVSDQNGQYVIPDLLVGVYHLTVFMPGYLMAEQTLVIYPGQDVSYNALIEAIGTDWGGVGTASGTIYDALTGNGVAGLTLKIREGISNVEGDVLETFETDSSGRYFTPELESGNYSVEISDDRPGIEERYLGTVINVKVLGGINIDNQDGTVSNTIQTGQMRIVLSWGATPRDLDSHLECNMDNGDRYHIFYMNRTFYSGGMDASDRIADLDLDDTDSYGPETTTIYRSDPGKYLFWVHNYTHDSEYGLAGSGACVQVYMGYSTVPTYIFYVPNETGYGWEVFSYDSVTGVLTPSNRMYENY